MGLYEALARRGQTWQRVTSRRPRRVAPVEMRAGSGEVTTVVTPVAGVAEERVVRTRPVVQSQEYVEMASPIEPVYEDEVVVRETPLVERVPMVERVPVVESVPVVETVLVSDLRPKIMQGLWLLLGFFEILMALRFLLRALGANQENTFATFIYGLSGWLVWPFASLLATPEIGASAFEWFTIVAMLTYWLLAWLISKLLLFLWSRPVDRRVVTHSTVREEHVVPAIREAQVVPTIREEHVIPTVQEERIHRIQ